MLNEILEFTKSSDEEEFLIEVDLLKSIKETIQEISLTNLNGISIQIYTELNYAKINAGLTGLQRVFSNLLQNSIQAMENIKGEISIHIDRIYIPKTGNSNNQSSCSYQIILRDQGTGISPKNLEKIFDPFFTTKKNKGGTGLGLSSVYSIIKRIGGNISVSSKLDVGTKFTIVLPCLDKSTGYRYIS